MYGRFDSYKNNLAADQEINIYQHFSESYVEYLISYCKQLQPLLINEFLKKFDQESNKNDITKT